MSIGKTIRLFLAEGTPGGLLTAEIMNWTGHVMAAPRSDVASLMKRDETRRTGIYLLLGDDPENLGEQLVYIGERDDVSNRLRQHSRNEDQGGKDFWDRAIVLTSKDANLTKAHARYLESRFILLATQTKRVRLLNSTTPETKTLPEADVSDMEYFISQAKIVLPVLGVNMFRSTPAREPGSAENKNDFLGQASPIFELHIKKDNLVARAQEIDGEFIIYEGSQARGGWLGADESYKKLRDKLESDGTLASATEGQHLRFTHNQVFMSPSAAAAVVVGRNANGRTEWRIQETRITYADWQAQNIDEAAGENHV